MRRKSIFNPSFDASAEPREPSPRTVDGVLVDLDGKDFLDPCQRNPGEFLNQQRNEKMLNEKLGDIFNTKFITEDETCAGIGSDCKLSFKDRIRDHGSLESAVSDVLNCRSIFNSAKNTTVAVFCEFFNVLYSCEADKIKVDGISPVGKSKFARVSQRLVTEHDARPSSPACN